MPNRKALSWIVIGISALVCCGFAPAWAAENNKPANGKSIESMDFNNVDIQVFIKFISDLTGKNFVVDPMVKGTVNVISPAGLSEEEAYRVFQSVLEVYGFTTIEGGSIVKIVPLQKAKDRGVEIIDERRGVPQKPSDVMVTRIIPLRYAEASELESMLGPLISKSSVIVSHPSTNTLVITDIESNINRLMSIIKEVDVPGFAKKITVVKLINADAKSLAEQLTQLMESDATVAARTVRNARTPQSQQVSTQLKIIPQERTNTLIILATLDDTQKIKRLIEQLDQPTPTGRDFIHVYYLKNAVAEDVAKVLGEIKQADEKDKTTVTKPAISESVLIVPDKATNSLVIRATPEEYAAMAKVIDQLDVSRAMVYVEGLIVEVSTEKALKLGVEWNVGKDFSGGSSVAFGGANAGSLGALSSLIASTETQDATIALPAGFLLGVLGENITFGEVTFPTISALINAVSNDTDFNILSTPQLLTTDNVEAEVKVAQNIPFLTQSAQGDQTTSRVIQSFEYKDVGVVLKVTPQINKDRFVRLNIEEEVKNVIQAQTQSSSGEVLLAPTTNVRSAKTTVIVKDGETVVIGGLVQDVRAGTEVSVPCLGSLPVLGAMFRTQSDSSSKTNLLVFLTPHIVENTAEARELYLQKKSEMEKIQRQQSTIDKPPLSDDAPKPQDTKEDKTEDKK